MEKDNIKEIDLLLLWRRLWIQRRLIFIWVGIGLIMGIIVAFSIPRRYESTIILAPEGTKSNMANSMGDLAGFMGMNMAENKDGVNAKLYPKVIDSRPFLLEFADMEVLYKGDKMPFHEYILEHQKSPWWTYILGAPGYFIHWVQSIGDKDKPNTPFAQNQEMQAVFVSILARQTDIKEQSNDEIFIISATMQDPDITLQVVDSLYIKLQQYMTTYRTSKTRFNLESNMKMLEEARHKYYRVDSIYSAAADRNQRVVLQTAKVKLDRLANEKELAFNIYQQLASQVATDKVKLQEETPIATIIEPAVKALYPSSPNKKLITILFGMLAGFGIVGWLVAKEIL